MSVPKSTFSFGERKRLWTHFSESWLFALKQIYHLQHYAWCVSLSFSDHMDFKSPHELKHLFSYLDKAMYTSNSMKFLREKKILLHHIHISKWIYYFYIHVSSINLINWLIDIYLSICVEYHHMPHAVLDTQNIWHIQ